MGVMVNLPQQHSITQLKLCVGEYCRKCREKILLGDFDCRTTCSVVNIYMYIVYVCNKKG